MAARLIVIAGPARGQVIPLDLGGTIGRDQSSAITIPDLALSRHHCTIEPTGTDGTTFILRDADSRNGTVVNGLPILQHQLADGDQIRIGDSVLIVVLESKTGATTARETLAPGSTVVAARESEVPVTPSLRFTTALTIERDLVGESPAMQAVYHRLSKAAPSESTVLIRGESGTGKELVAHAIHANSARAHGPFVAINCAAVPEGLIESELFGHEKGAFTGAVAQKKGRLEMANGGTAFFDEIGELAPSLQAKLLRVLQDRQVERLGSTRAIPIDVRIVAATNRDLEAAVKTGAFRQDLFYRLNVIPLTLPPLRDRLGDLPLLITYFVRKHAVRTGRKVRGVTREARARLMKHDWPGNVRELENTIERALVLGSEDWIGVNDLPEQLLEGPPETQAGADTYYCLVNDAKRQVIREAVDRSAGNLAQAARLLHLQPTYLHRLMRKLAMKESTS
jgi:transcriptional regulator with PAS, ATPase and Fis domain